MGMVHRPGIISLAVNLCSQLCLRLIMEAVPSQPQRKKKETTNECRFCFICLVLAICQHCVMTAITGALCLALRVGRLCHCPHLGNNSYCQPVGFNKSCVGITRVISSCYSCVQLLPMNVACPQPFFVGPS